MEARAAQRAEEMKNRGDGAFRAIAGGNNVMMGASEEANQPEIFNNLALGKYNKANRKTNEFFTSYPADAVFDIIKNNLMDKFDLKSKDIQTDSKEWKMLVTFTGAQQEQPNVEN